MPTSTTDADAIDPASADEALALSRLEEQLPPLLSVIAGMVDLTGFFTLGNIFTAHITGNLVVAAAAAVRGGPLNLAQALAIPVFMAAVAAVGLIARTSGRHGRDLARLLLLAQFLLLAGVLIFSVITKPSANPHGLMAGIAVMIAVAAMACQFALMRVAIPGAISTAVMTGNLTNTILSLLDTLYRGQPLISGAGERLKKASEALMAFFGGCIAGAAAVSWLGEWSWSLPVALAGIAVAL